MRTDTLNAVRAVVLADTTAPNDERQAVLAALTPTARRMRETGTIRDATAILNCHPRTVGLYAKRGLVHQIKITPRKIRYDLTEVRRLAGVEVVESAQVAP